MNKFLLVLSLCLVILSIGTVSAISSLVYQENGNETGYAYDSGSFGYVYMNYTKLAGSVSPSIWQVRISQNATNVTIPQQCWERYTDKIEFELVSSVVATNSTSRAKCYGTTTWVQLAISSDSTVGVTANYWDDNRFYALDGNWSNNGTFYYSGGAAGLRWSRPTLGQMNDSLLFEEAMIWNVSTYTENSQNYSMVTSSNTLETFNLNFTTGYTVNSAKLIYNNTEYSADSIDSYGSGTYLASKQITVPYSAVSVNKSFYWAVNLSDGNVYNSSFHNQSIYVNGLDSCGVYTHKVLNYTVYDEISQLYVPDGNNQSIALEVYLYGLDYSTLIMNFSSNSSSSNLMVCSLIDLGNASYYLDATAQYTGGDGYATKFNNIQKYLVLNASLPVIVPLYSLNSSLSTEFTVTFKDENFILDPNVIVDVSRKYIPEGVFKTVEVAKTGSNGQTILHLQLSNTIYTIVFKKYGVILSVLDNVIAKCQSTVLGTCEINENSFSSSLNVDDFNFVNGVSSTQSYDSDTRTITANFISESGTKTVSLNITKFDRFGNSTVCSTSVTSSSGVLSCVVPSSFGNSTVISRVYSNGQLVSSAVFSNGTSSPDTSGSYIILALMIVITLSMMFISDPRGMLLGCFLGLVMTGLLLYVNQGSLFSVGTALTWALIAVVIIIWKISQKEER